MPPGPFQGVPQHIGERSIPLNNSLTLRPVIIPRVNMGYTSTNDVKLPILLNDASPPFSSSCCDVLIAEAWLQHMQERHAFDIRVLVHIIQVQFDINSIKGYLNAFPETSVRSTLRCPVPAKSMFSPTYPVLFYAAQQNSPELVRVLCEAGANPDHRAAISGLPLLVYLITSAENEHIDVTETLSALLAMGCSPYAVPPTLWVRCISLVDGLLLPVRLVSSKLIMCNK